MSVQEVVAVLQAQLEVQKEQLAKQKEHFEEQLAAKQTATRSRPRLCSTLSRQPKQRHRSTPPLNYGRIT